MESLYLPASFVHTAECRPKLESPQNPLQQVEGNLIIFTNLKIKQIIPQQLNSQ